MSLRLCVMQGKIKASWKKNFLLTHWSTRILWMIQKVPTLIQKFWEKKSITLINIHFINKNLHADDWWWWVHFVDSLQREREEKVKRCMFFRNSVCAEARVKEELLSWSKQSVTVSYDAKILLRFKCLKKLPLFSINIFLLWKSMTFPN